MLGDDSIKYTCFPISARSSDACIPATPAPRIKMLLAKYYHIKLIYFDRFFLLTKLNTFNYSLIIQFSHIKNIGEDEQSSLTLISIQKINFKKKFSLNFIQLNTAKNINIISSRMQFDKL